MKISEYKSKNNLSFESLSALLGISKTKLHRVLSGDMQCLRAFEVSKIVTATNGEVTAMEILEEAAEC
jgi:DNA-binding transcriptional regulator YdaS (Cro superfamily)